ncbi:MAG: flagellar protein FlaG [Desulfurella sp.]|uniref:flagellar protein FlaG n=1 Tax=Desulfurella sp. TaxID=1962857 RepID=UPI003CBC8087
MDVNSLGKVNLAVAQDVSQSRANIATTQESVSSLDSLANKSSPANQGLQTNTNALNNANISKQDVKNLVKKLNDSIGTLNDSVKFSYSEDAKALVVKVVDSKTGQVIRQIPPEELIKLEANLTQSIGIIFNKEVK